MATKTQDIDITKTGPQGFRELQDANLNPFESVRPVPTSLYDIHIHSEQYVSSPLANSNTTWGESMFDNTTATEEQFSQLGDIRAENQPWYSKLGAGISKGVALAGTTFLDGTIGLVYGIGSAIGNGDISKLWDNEVSNGLREVNEAMEEWMPNYRTVYEQTEMSLWEKLGTVNFWADSVIKNLGFTVGALYSGGIYTKGLKAAGLLSTSMGAKVIGSVLSAVNEGRIEANHNIHDWKEYQYAQLNDDYERLVNDIKNNAEYTADQKEASLTQIAENKKLQEAGIEERATKVGLMDFIGNTVLLSVDNFYTFGRLYARGFKSAKDKVAGRVKKSMNKLADEAAEREAIDEVGDRIIREGAQYTYNPITKKRAIGKGLLTGAREGNEEMAQQWLANTSGEYQNYDSPDAYYNALLDPEAERQTKDFTTALAQGFMDSYGNRDQWEQFAVGAFTSLFGVPTFGKVNNSDVNTWLGRDKSIGISGGIFGEIGEANRQNREGQEAVDYMNRYMSKLQEKERHFVQSQSFTNAMDGWAEEGNAFEYKNAEDNDDFAAISRFAKTGKLDDLKDMVEEDFENISNEELAKIATFTTDDSGRGGWRNPDGSLMSDSEDGRYIMRVELTDKRDKILSEIDRYEKSIRNVRAIGNNSLDEDQVNELAWLDWKVGRFDERFKSIKEENSQLFTSLSNGLLDFRNAIDKKSEEGQKWLKSVNNMLDFVSYLQGAKSSLDLARRIAANPKLMEVLSNQDTFNLFAMNSGLRYSDYTTVMDNLRDAAKIATAAKTFNDRYKEFVEDPIKLIQNREAISNKKEKVAKASEAVSDRDKIEEAEVSDIVAGAESGELNLGDLEGLYTKEDGTFLEEGVPSGKGKVEETKKIIETSSSLDKALDEIAEREGTDQQAVEDAKKLLNASKRVSNSAEEFTDLETEAFNDPQLLLIEDASINPEVDPQELADSLDDRIANAKTIIEEAKATMEDRQERYEDIPNEIAEGQVEKKVGQELVGHDATERGVPVNQETKPEEKTVTREEKAKEAASGDAQLAKDIQTVLASIDMLFQAGATDKEIFDKVSQTEAYKRAVQMRPYVVVTFQRHLNSLKEAQKKDTSSDSSTSTYNAESEEEVITPVVVEQDIRTISTEQSKQNLNEGETPATYQYWKRTTTEYPIHFTKGDTTPYYVIAETVDKHKYTEQQLKRMKAVYTYLKTHGAYGLVNSGAIKKGNKVGFLIDKSLNDEAGEIVILMTDSQGRVIGDIMSKNDKPFTYQVGLPQFVERTEQAYKEAGEPAIFFSPESTVVDKNMIGFAPYTADTESLHTLNEISSTPTILSGGITTNTTVPFTLGIALTSGTNARIAAAAGRRKKQGQSDMERTIIPPLKAKAGQPYLLLPTSSSTRAFLPVPILMPTYSTALDNTMIGKAITTALEKLRGVTNATAMQSKRDIQELLAIPELHINILENGNLKVTIKPQGADKQTTIFNGKKDDPELVNKIKAGLTGTSIQVSRKYVNDTYNGTDYNKMIGEIARTNLPIGTTHTVGEWVTVAPLGTNGEVLKAKSPKSQGQNPNQAAPTYREIEYKGMTLRVDTKTFEVTDEKGQVYGGPKADLIKAEVWGYLNNAPTDKPFNTQWGWFNPTTKQFVDAPNVTVKSVGEELLPNATEIAKQKGLLNNPVRKALWEVLTPEQQTIIANKKGPKQLQWMEALEGAFNTSTKSFDETKLKGTVDEYLARKGLYRRETSKYHTWNRNQEMRWLKRVLPNLSDNDHVRIVNGLIKIAGEDAYAWGQFKQGVIYLSDRAARGTLYHEAFHAVTHTLLSNDERGKMFEEARKKYGELPLVALEENLAEDFRRYTQVEEIPFLGGLVKFFRTLKHLVRNLVGKEPYLDAMFYRINRGDYSTRTAKDSKATRNRRSPYDIQNAITKLRRDYVIAAGQVNSRRASDPYVIDSYIKDSGLAHVLYRYQQNNNGMYSIARISKENYEKELNKLRRELNDSWNSELSDDIRRSNELLEEQESYYRRIDQYHKDKTMYGNLSQEDKDYIKARKITVEEYNRMSPLEREILFRCQY